MTPGPDAVWTISKLLASLQGYFAKNGSDSPRLDAEVLLGHVLQCERIHLYTRFDQPLTDAERDTLRALAKRRSQGEPIAYLVGCKEFYSRDFAVNAHVLIPRPETEHVVESALAWHAHARPVAPRICDVGTGSGAIGITLACEIEDAHVVLADLSVEALAVAQKNAERHGVADRITCVHANLLEGMAPSVTQVLQPPFDIIVSNPPYIATGEMAQLPRDVAHYEPHLALAAGPQGLDCLQALCAQLPPHLGPAAFVALEMGEGQGDAVRAALGRVLPHCATVKDLAGSERVVAGWHDESFSLADQLSFLGRFSSSRDVL